MGCCISKRPAPPAIGSCGLCETAVCECQGVGRDRRNAVFHLLHNSLAGGQPDNIEPYIVCMLFTYILFLKSSKCNVTCSDMWIKPENITAEEKQRIRHSFPIFAERFITLEHIHFVHAERNVLSGLVLFRTELFPIFLGILDSDDSMTNEFYEDRVQNLHPSRAGHIIESIKETHPWWNENFIDKEEMNETGEYELTD